MIEKGEEKSEVGEDREGSTARTEASASSLREFEHALDELLRIYAAYNANPLRIGGAFLDAKTEVLRLFRKAQA